MVRPRTIRSWKLGLVFYSKRNEKCMIVMLQDMLQDIFVSYYLVEIATFLVCFGIFIGPLISRMGGENTSGRDIVSTILVLSLLAVLPIFGFFLSWIFIAVRHKLSISRAVFSWLIPACLGFVLFTFLVLYVPFLFVPSPI